MTGVIVLNAVIVWMIICEVNDGILWINNSLWRNKSRDCKKQGWRRAAWWREIHVSREVVLLAIYYIFAVLLIVQMKLYKMSYILLFIGLPFVVRKIIAIREERKIEQGIVGFLGCLNARLMVDNDIIQALENTRKIVPNKGIKRILTEFSVALTISCDPALAFEKMQNIKNSYLRYVFINLQNVLDSWGESKELVRELESEYISAQIEIHKGRVELQNDKIMTYIGLGLAAFTALNIVAHDAGIMSYYMARPQIAIVLGCIALSGVWVLVSTKISAF